ncbi:MAG TPA: NAD(P)(+) transhydrogenase (Re/Si-specific) subunit beta [Gemmatimonadaceae bacterium]|nr:NAD(P)(+) transhydrogenase (Re/Si-specific) subunit beta [Gemmatimonadaceae bacterium]
MSGLSGTGVAIAIAYLVASVLFIFGLKLLSSAATARRGNLIAGIGMLVAVAATLLEQEIVTLRWIALGVVIGAVAGLWLAAAVKMTAMPQMVALLNGFGGGASALVAAAEFYRIEASSAAVTTDVALSTALTMLIGAVTFTGSLVAFAKLQEMVTGRAVTYPLQKPINALLFLGALAAIVILTVAIAHPGVFLALTIISLLLGVLLVIPIGGADMPVVISLLNSYSGIAGAAAGFVLHNNVLIIAGALVGASGIILTQIMCRAMNRSLTNVLFGAFGAQAATAAAGGTEARPMRAITADDAAVMLAYAQSVIVIPGYGLAVAQGQHTVRELASLLEKRGVDVKYAIHPVAGRMPGHMNVILSEAQVDYDALINSLDEANSLLDRADVALVVGANDTVNPAAENDRSSPLYGMPVVEAWKAKQVIVMKRGRGTGFAGVDNALFYGDNTSMLFGDAKKSLTELVSAVKGV